MDITQILSMIGSVLIGLVVFDGMIMLVELVENYLIRRNNKNQNVVATTKEKEKD
jgi:hypothetical protein